jgi:hypothetical protein
LHSLVSDLCIEAVVGAAMIVLAKLIKHSTADRLMQMQDTIPLGTMYRVDVATRHVMTFRNLPSNIVHEKEIIQEYPHRPDGWLPVELLELLGAP